MKNMFGQNIMIDSFLKLSFRGIYNYISYNISYIKNGLNMNVSYNLNLKILIL